LVAASLVALAIGDRGRIDRQATWLRVLSDPRIAVIGVANSASV
jgi:hypothetical protein